MATTTNAKRISGPIMAILGFVLLVLNAAAYLFSWNQLGSRLVPVGIMLMVVGAGLARGAGASYECHVHHPIRRIHPFALRSPEGLRSVVYSDGASFELLIIAKKQQRFGLIKVLDGIWALPPW